jgi:2-iminobutanoate/2-iminopropanoate deaminase
MDDVIRVDVFLADLDDFNALNDEYRTWFSEPFPARTTVGVKLLSGLSVEVTVLAVGPVDDANGSRQKAVSPNV